jgi:hypothetical protein
MNEYKFFLLRNIKSGFNLHDDGWVVWEARLRSSHKSCSGVGHFEGDIVFLGWNNNWNMYSAFQSSTCR